MKEKTLISNDHVTVVNDEYGFLTFTVVNATVFLGEVCISVDKFLIHTTEDVRIRIHPYNKGKQTAVIVKDGDVTIKYQD